jgi:glycerol uptake facilitator-like aquaporin
VTYPLSRRLAAEFVGTAFLLATVIGSGVMGEALSSGNIAIALLGNTIPTGAILYVLITALGPVSGAHFNPAVTFAFSLSGDIARGDALFYVFAQVAGALAGVLLAHVMFDLPVFEISAKVRSGPGQWISEGVATAGLVLTIFATLRADPGRVAQAVALFITAAYWFTASTSFANPAVTLARAFSDTFAGIRLIDAPAFIAVQMVAAFLAFRAQNWLFSRS